MITPSSQESEKLTDVIKNNGISEIDKLNISVQFWHLIKTAATDKQWLTKRSKYNHEIWEAFERFINTVVKKALTNYEPLGNIDFSHGVPSAIVTHHQVFREAFELFIMQQLEPLYTFEYNIEKDGILPLKKILFYLGHTLNLETNNEQFKKLLQNIQDILAQYLFSTVTYLLINTKQTAITSRIQIEWLASLFLNEETTPITEYIIGHWTRKVLIHSLIAQSFKTPKKEPETDEEREMCKEIIFSIKSDGKNK